jgi:acid phosphatase type 7
LRSSKPAVIAALGALFVVFGGVASSGQTSAAATGPPVNTALPSISGSVVVGQTLTAAPGSWTNSPTGYSYQWLQCDSSGANCVAISGATASTYVLQRADLGKTVRVSVTASNDAGSSAPATSNQTVKVAGTLPQNTSPPTFSPTSGLASGVTTVTVASNGSWSGVPTPTQWAYQWQSCTSPTDGSTCSAIAGATASSYALTAAQVGSYIRLGVRATNVCSSGCGSTWAYSTESGEPVVDSAPTNTAAPTISGSAQAGQILTATTGSWTNYPTGYAYQWRRCDTAGSNCSDITGATSAAYAVGQADVGATLRVRVTATNGIGSGTADSAATDQIAAGPPPPSNTSQPVISGTTQEGQTLTADPGAWDGDNIGFSFRWRRCTQAGTPCLDITAATDATYTLTSADVGARMQFVVTATNAGGSTQAMSDVTSVIIPLPQPTGDPAIAAAGDIACDPSNTHFNNGFGTSNDCHELSTSSLLLGAPLAGVLPLGDNQYGCGGYQAFLSSYDPSWGRVKSITHPAIGNHEYLTSSSEGSTDCDPTGSASGYFTYFGAAAGDPSGGYYSYEVAGWHFVVLNSNCSKSSGCYAGSVQEKWLKADLAAHPANCTLAYWHHPRYSSVTSSSAPGQYFNDLIAAGADIVLTGHVHNYERFAPQNGSGGYDPAAGIREFVVGTGGESLQGFPTVITNSEVQLKRFGVLMLTLHAGSYDWAFVADDGITLDSGTGYCH